MYEFQDLYMKKDIKLRNMICVNNIIKKKKIEI